MSLARSDPSSGAVVAPPASWVAAAAAASLVGGAHVLGALLAAALAAVGRPIHALPVREGGLKNVNFDYHCHPRHNLGPMLLKCKATIYKVFKNVECLSLTGLSSLT